MSLLACVIGEGRANVGRSPVIVSRCAHKAETPSFSPTDITDPGILALYTSDSDSTYTDHLRIKLKTQVRWPIHRSPVQKDRYGLGRTCHACCCLQSVIMAGKLRTTAGLAAVLVAVCSLLVPTNATCVLPVSPFQVRLPTKCICGCRHKCLGLHLCTFQKTRIRMLPDICIDSVDFPTVY